MARIHWIWFSELKIPYNDKYILLDEFGDPEIIYNAAFTDYRDHGISTPLAEKLLRSNDLQSAARIESNCARMNTGVIPISDKKYPDRLRNIDNPPVLLYVNGTLPDMDHIAAVSVVGTRKASRHSLEIAYDLSHELAENEIIIVSGMAAGIDAEANRAAIDAAGYTVAVLGCGNDICYPYSSRPIYNRILSGSGCLISEYPPGTRPSGSNFPARNRIISGLSLGVLLIAAPERSGSLITANLAADQGRDVFAVPGRIDDAEYTGSNELIKQGASPVTGTYDIVMQYRQRYPYFFRGPEPVYAGRMKVYRGRKQEPEEKPAQKRPYKLAKAIAFASDEETEKKNDISKYESVLKTLSPKARQIMSCMMSGESLHIDKIVELSGVSAPDALTELTFLEIEGAVVSLPGKFFKIN